VEYTTFDSKKTNRFLSSFEKVKNASKLWKKLSPLFFGKWQFVHLKHVSRCFSKQQRPFFIVDAMFGNHEEDKRQLLAAH
jgi:predicted metal-binding membrane protein